MADWRKLAKALALSDGRITEREVAALQEHLFGDGVVAREELEFLFELRREAATVTRGFRQMLYEALSPVVLADGTVDAKEAEWLGRFLEGTTPDADEAAFLKELLAKATTVSAEFQALCRKRGVTGGK